MRDQRIGSVLAAVRSANPRAVVDLGCGEGSLLRELLGERSIDRVVGLDVCLRSLEIAEKRLKLDRMSARQRERIQLLHGSLTYRDDRLTDFDVATIVEVIEHLDPPRLAAFERTVFQYARPRCVVMTTPNREYNVHFEGLDADKLRHPDHRFEWTRTEFSAWCSTLSERYGYSARHLGVGPEDTETGSPTQMAIFDRTAKRPSVVAES